MNKLGRLFRSVQCPVIGMVHVKALPGTPKYQNDFDRVVSKAVQEAALFNRHQLDGLLIENLHDVPYMQERHLGPETVACMSRIATEVRKAVPHLPIGIQILASANKQALAVAKACDLQFIRAEGFVYGHVADEGYTDACAGQLLRYRRHIDADHILTMCDIKKKHSSHAITADVDLVQTAHAAEYFLADALVLTGDFTGCAANLSDLDALHAQIDLPRVIGSGITTANVADFFAKASGVIVGSYFKEHGHCNDENLSEEVIEQFMQKMKGLRSQKTL